MTIHYPSVSRPRASESLAERVTRIGAVEALVSFVDSLFESGSTYEALELASVLIDPVEQDRLADRLHTLLLSRANSTTHGLLVGDGIAPATSGRSGPTRLALMGDRLDAEHSILPLEECIDLLCTMAGVSLLRRSGFAVGPTKLVDLYRELFDDMGIAGSEGQVGEETQQPLEIVIITDDRRLQVPGAGLAWLVIAGDLAAPGQQGDFAFPPARRFTPLPLDVEISDESVLDQIGSVEYLKAIAPIGCRNHSTLLRLKSRGIPAFLSEGLLEHVSQLLAEHTKRHDTEPQDTKPQDPRERHDDSLVTLLADGDLVAKLRGALHPDAWIHAEDELTHVGPKRRVGIGAPGNQTLDHQSLTEDVERARLSDPIALGLTAIADGMSPQQFVPLWRRKANPLVELTDRHVDAWVKESISAVSEAAPVVDFVSRARHDDDSIHVVLAYDANLSAVAQVTIASAVRRSTVPLHVHVLGRGLDEGRLVAFGEKIGVKTTLYAFDEVDHGQARIMGHIGSPSTMDRLLIPSFFPELNRAIYLDVDTLVLGDLAELARVDLSSHPFAARPLPHTRGAFHHILDDRAAALSDHDEMLFRSWLFGIDFDMRVAQFNAGVLLLDLALMRDDAFLEEFCGAVEVFQLNDQDLLNIYGGGRFAAIPPSWNHLVGTEYVERPQVVHYAGPKKPWKYPAMRLGGPWWQEVDDLEHAGQLVWPVDRPPRSL